MAMPSSIELMHFYSMLNEVKFKIDESSFGEVTLDNYITLNSGNNCMHYTLMCDNERIVIQCYKRLSRKGDIDIVQGKYSSSSVLEEIVDFLNMVRWSDDTLNKIFILYSWFKLHYSGFYWGEMDSFTIEFNFGAWVYWIDNHFVINCADCDVEPAKELLWFIEEWNKICQ